MKANIKKAILGLLAALTLLAVVPFASASAQTATSTAPKTGCNVDSTFFPRWYDGELCDKKTGGVVSPASFDPNDSAKSFSKWAGVLAMNLVTILLYVVGYVSLGFIIFGGFKYMTSGDNSGGTAAAQKTIQNAVIGLVLSIMSVGLVRFIAEAIK